MLNIKGDVYNRLLSMKFNVSSNFFLKYRNIIEHKLVHVYYQTLYKSGMNTTNVLYDKQCHNAKYLLKYHCHIRRSA